MLAGRTIQKPSKKRTETTKETAKTKQNLCKIPFILQEKGSHNYALKLWTNLHKKNRFKFWVFDFLNFENYYKSKRCLKDISARFLHLKTKNLYCSGVLRLFCLQRKILQNRKVHHIALAQEFTIFEKSKNKRNRIVCFLWYSPHDIFNVTLADEIRRGFVGHASIFLNFLNNS